MPSMTVHESFKLFPGNGIRVAWPPRLWHSGCIFVGVRWAQAHLNSLAGKEQTVGGPRDAKPQIAQGRWLGCRGRADDLPVANTKQTELREDRRWERVLHRPFMARERVWPMLKRTVRRRGDGFSLIEMLIVISIMGVLVAVLMPSMVTSFRQRATRGAVDRLAMTHSLARATSVRFGRVAELRIDAINARFWVEVDTSGTGIRDTIGTVNQLEGVTMSSDRERLCFDSRGLATSRGQCEPGNALVQFSLAGRTDTFQTTALGKVLR